MIPKIGFTKCKNYIINKVFLKNRVFWDTNIANHVELNNVEVGAKVSFAKNASVNNSKIGKYTSIGRNTKITNTDIGAFCAISWDSTINAIQHPLTHLTIHAFPYVSEYGGVEKRTDFYQRVTVNNDVWIGANSVILPGLKIGNGAIIAANTLVTRNVPDYAIIAGVPAKTLRFRFRKEMIDKLLELKWWELDFDVIKRNISVFQNDFKMKNLADLEKIVLSQT